MKAAATASAMRKALVCFAAGFAVFSGEAARASDSNPTEKPLTPRTAAQIDLTGYWVSVVTEDWTIRMVAPKPGDAGSIPLNRAGWEAAARWDPAKDGAAGQPCKAFGAAGLMRRPGRLHITWQDDSTLRIDFDAGSQTRLLRFATFLPPSGFATTELPLALLRFDPPEAALTLQGHSIAAWRKVAQVKGFDRFGSMGTPPPAPGKGGSLVALTTRMSAAYLQPNGIPYSEHAVLTEYFNRVVLPNGETWLVVTSVLDDPQYLLEPYVTSTHFKREPDGSRWDPTPCAQPVAH